MGSLEDVKAYLKSTTNSKGVDLYRHLTEVFSKLLREKPENAYQDFEVFSSFVKKFSFNYNEPRDSKTVNSIQARSTEHSTWV
jgi:radial spoke head protein 4A